MSQDATQDELGRLLTDEEFVKKLINKKTLKEAQSLFEENNVYLNDKDMKKIAHAINQGFELKEESLTNVSGGVTMEGIKKASKQYLKGAAYGLEGVLAYPLEPLIAVVFSALGDNKYEIGSGSKWYREGAASYFRKGTKELKETKGEEYNTPWK